MKNESTRLQETAYKLKAILNSTNERIVLIGTDYKILSFNKQAEKDAMMVFGKPLHEMVDIRDYFPGDGIGRFLEDAQKVFNGEHMAFDTMLADHHFHVSYHPVYDDDQQKRKQQFGKQRYFHEAEYTGIIGFVQ